MKQFNILSLGMFDAAGVNTQFSKKWNELGYGNWQTYFQYNYMELPETLKNGVTTFDELINIINKTDVFFINPFLQGGETEKHLMNDWDIITCDNKYILNYVLKTGKPIIMYINGSNNARKYCLFYQQQFKYFNFNIACSTPDLLEYYPEAKYLPMFIDYSKPFWNLKKYKRDYHVMGHFPTNPKIKNTSEYLELAKKMDEEKSGIKFFASQGLSHKQCINHKRDMTFTFDHLQGYYGVNSLESAALGVINFVKIDETYLKSFYKIAGTNTTPWTLVNNIQDVEDKLKWFINNPVKITKEQLRTRKWLETHWSPEKHIKRIYNYISSLASSND